MELLRTGKVKEVYAFGPEELLFRFTNNISVFDKIIPTAIEKKGEVLNRTAAYWFEQCEKLGIHTHFGKVSDKDKMVVKRVEVIPDYDKLDTKRGNYLIPLEVICRHYLAGSMHDRIKKGKVKPESLGFPAGKVPPYGAKFPKPFVEFTTKLEPVDRPLTEEEAQKIASLTDEEFQAVKDAVLAIDDVIAKRAAEAGLIHVDGKKEFAFDNTRTLMVVDTFGTPDEDRWWDAEKHAAGEFVELSKEFVRQHYRRTGYHETLMAAREAGKEDPPIPALPDDVSAAVTDLYVNFYERMTGQPF